MRMLMHVHIPNEPFNSYVKDGTASQRIQQAMDEIKPEAAYFSEQHGQRGGVLVVDLPDPSRVPALAEPLFLTLNARVEIRVAMTPEDLAKSGIDELGRKYG